MQVNLNKAMNSLKSTEKLLRQEIAPKGKFGGTKDSVEIGGSGQVKSSDYLLLQQDLKNQLSSLTGMVGDNTGQQKSLNGLFNDANNTDEVRARAQELLEGYFNVENTGDRIFDFAFSHYKGGDREAFAEEFRGYIHKGFDEAEKMLGGLADISHDTRDYVDKRIDDFINEGKEEGESEPVEEPAPSV